MKTPQQVFALMSKKWEEIDHIWYDGICLKIVALENMGLISREEYRASRLFLELHRPKNCLTAYWWPSSDQKTRKKFVKYLSKIKS